jgi:intracellular sulfur oxidation DsrE/DsrF family protein
MKKFLLVLLFLNITINFVQAQQNPIENYGSFYLPENPDISLDITKPHKVIFDIAITGNSPKAVNPLIEAAARYMNLHNAMGLSVDKQEIVLIFHGRSIYDILSPAAYKKAAKQDNPNQGLIEALQAKGVKMYICAQSMNYRGFTEKDYKDNGIMIAPSAMTALVYFQEQGYNQINFN